MMRGPGAKAFTLLELLAVVAVIGVLTALLLPVLANTKELGRIARCQTNLRQLSLAMEMYVSDNGRYPYYLMVGSSPTNWLSWDGALLPYTRSRWTDPLYRCPSYRYPSRTMSFDPAAGAWVAPQGSYGYNWIGTGELPLSSGASILHLGLGAIALQSGRPVEASRKESDVRLPAGMAELGDGGGGQISPPSSVAPPYQRFAHRKLLNVTFCDGHVETVSGVRFYEATAEARRRFNFDHEPHPETWEEVSNGNIPSAPPPPPAAQPDDDSGQNTHH